jgi:hypothetical protein
MAGAAQLEAPQYDLAAVGDDLRARPAQVAKLGAAIEGTVTTAKRFPRWVVLGSLGLAALVLLVLLARALPRMPESEASRHET